MEQCAVPVEHYQRRSIATPSLNIMQSYAVNVEKFPYGRIETGGDELERDVSNHHTSENQKHPLINGHLRLRRLRASLPGSGSYVFHYRIFKPRRSSCRLQTQYTCMLYSINNTKLAHVVS